MPVEDLAIVNYVFIVGSITPPIMSEEWMIRGPHATQLLHGETNLNVMVF